MARNLGIGTTVQCNNCDKYFTHKILLFRTPEKTHWEKNINAVTVINIIPINVVWKYTINHTLVRNHIFAAIMVNVLLIKVVWEYTTQLISGKKLQYSYCAKCIASNSQLVSHQRTHASDKSYQSIQCDKCFGQKMRHVRAPKNHTGEKPYQCSHCDKCFTHKSSLVGVHTIHIGEIFINTTILTNNLPVRINWYQTSEHTSVIHQIIAHILTNVLIWMVIWWDNVK